MRNYIEVPVKGQLVRLRCAHIFDYLAIVQGRWPRIASLYDQELSETDVGAEVETIIPRLKEHRLRADIFTFAQNVSDRRLNHPYHTEWESLAALPITELPHWLERVVEKDVRTAVRKAARLGVEVRVAKFDDDLVRGIAEIYNESPVRQGRAFWHYQKSHDAVRRENATYLDRSLFIGAYHDRELIGFIKMVRVRSVAMTLQVIGKRSHFNKKPMNALVAKAVEECSMRSLSHLIYSTYEPNSPLTEFKRRCGFRPLSMPRYYIPLNRAGELAIILGSHRGLTSRLPQPMFKALRRIRNMWMSRRMAPLKRQ